MITLLYLFLFTFILFITIVFEYEISYLDLIIGENFIIKKSIFGLIACSLDLDINIYNIRIKIKEIHHVSECYLFELFKKKYRSVLVENIISLTILYIIIVVLYSCFKFYVLNK